MTTWTKLAATLFIVTTIGLELRSILGPYEDWPFTSNTMFAYYRQPKAPLYDLRFTVYDESGYARQLEPRADLGSPNYDAWRRLMFSRFYGSTDPRFPQGGEPTDSASFVTRMGDLCHRIVTVMHRRGQPVAKIDIDLDQVANDVDSVRVINRHPVGQCQGDDGQFVFAPQ